MKGCEIMLDKQRIKNLRGYVAWASILIAFFGIGGGMFMYFNDLKPIGVIWTILGSFASIALPVKALHEKVD
jgi:hypothetical protein